MPFQQVLLFLAGLVVLCFMQVAFGQFPAVCNTLESLQAKRCCPNDCGSALGRGSCEDVTTEAMEQEEQSNQTIAAVLANSKNERYKGTIDSRYLWPTMVFNWVCRCNGNYYGPDCGECNFGWTGSTCSERTMVTRKDFRELTSDEKSKFFQGLSMLKHETAPLYWSVITKEPNDTSGRVMLDDVTTYDYLVYIHNYVSRDASEACQVLNEVNVDFAHSGPNFPIWHRTYMLILERAMQRVLGNASFGFPYWSWEDDYIIFDDLSSQLGALGSGGEGMGHRRNVGGGILDNNWKSVCDITYRNGHSGRQGNAYFDIPEGSDTEMLCNMYWTPCNVTSDLEQNRPLQRGNKERYLPGLREVQMAIEAPVYDAPDPYGHGTFQQKVMSSSFRGRLEGWSFLCSGIDCVSPLVTKSYQRMHNIVHDWVDGHMSVPPSAVNDPVFSLHHCNIDRILESWMRKYYSIGESLRPYVPASGGHIGHNRDDFMVPFFPLITPGEQYKQASVWGYQYDNLISDDIKRVLECEPEVFQNPAMCHICKTDSTCTYYVKNDPFANPYGPNNICSDESINRCQVDQPRPTNQPSSGASKLSAKDLILLITTIVFTTSGYLHV